MGAPLLVFDGDCGFCTASVTRAVRLAPAASAVPYQVAGLEALGTTAERAAYEVLWVGRDGRIRGGAQAVAAVLVEAGGAWRAAGLLLRMPPFRWIAHGVYRAVAANRHRLPGGTCALPAHR